MIEEEHSVVMEVKGKLLTGGGGGPKHGGSRSNAGRKSDGRKEYNRSNYGPISKKDQKKLKESNRNIKDLFSKQTKISGKQTDTEEIDHSNV